MAEPYVIMAMMEHTADYIRRRWPTAHTLVTMGTHYDNGVCVHVRDNVSGCLMRAKLGTIDKLTNRVINGSINQFVISLDSFESNIGAWYNERPAYNRPTVLTERYPYIATWFTMRYMCDEYIRISFAHRPYILCIRADEHAMVLLEQYLRQYEKYRTMVNGAMRLIPTPISQAINEQL